jgi:hypothetical protein
MAQCKLEGGLYMSYRYRVARPAPVINLNNYKIEHGKDKENMNTTEELIEEITPIESNNTKSSINIQYMDEKRGYSGDWGIIAVIIVLVLLVLFIDF